MIELIMCGEPTKMGYILPCGYQYASTSNQAWWQYPCIVLDFFLIISIIVIPCYCIVRYLKKRKGKHKTLEVKK